MKLNMKNFVYICVIFLKILQKSSMSDLRIMITFQSFHVHVYAPALID